MKKMKWLRAGAMAAVLAVCGGVTAAYALVYVLRDDHTPPEITVESEILEVSVTAEESAMLQGVTAEDKRDADVTESLVVEGLSPIGDDHTATVTYAAFDRAGNVAKASRTVQFTDYASPVFQLNRALVFQSSFVPDILSYLSAEDILDGDISGRIKGTLVSETGSLTYPGVHQVEFRVTNSMGDTQRITLPVDVYEPGEYNGTVELTEYLVRIKPFSAFRPESYLESLTVGTTAYPLTRQPEPEDPYAVRYGLYINDYHDPRENTDRGLRIINVDMNSNVDTTRPGVYSVTYRVSVDDNYHGFTRLHVIVEE